MAEASTWWAAEPGMPYDETAERATLGGMLRSDVAVADALEVLRTEDFYHPAHAAVFRAIIDLYFHGEPTDVVATVDQLLKTGTLDTAGGAAAVHDLTSTAGVPEGVSHYARIVAEKSTLRRLADAADHIGRVSRSGQADAADVAHWAADHVNDANLWRTTDQGSVFDAALDGAIEQVEAAQSHRGLSVEVESGIAGLDGLTGGFRPGELIVIAGATGAGKTMLALTVARRAAFGQQFPTVMFSLELSRSEIATRVASAETGVPLESLRSGLMDSRAWTSLAAFRGGAAGAPLHLDDRQRMTIDDLRLSARQRRTRGGLRLIVVDHMQLLSGDRVSRELKMLARDLRVPVFAVSQMGPGPAAGLDGVPPGVAQDADLVIVVRDGQLTVEKNRHGPTAAIPAVWEPAVSRFSTLPDHTAERITA